MDVGTALSVAQTLFAALQCSELKEICSFFGKESQLVEFKSTVDTVKAVLLDAQDKEVVTNKHEAELYIQRLKDAVYDADDLLDEFVTLAEQKQLMKDGKASEKLANFFSRHNPFLAARKMSQEVKKIKRTLDAIASDHSKFGFSVDSQLIRKRREETCSYVYTRSIVGRDADMEKIVGLLLDSNVTEDVSFLTIVGTGGLGKTALAQLVFNDTRVISAFPLRLWACVSDHEQDELDVGRILRKILASATGHHQPEDSTKDSVQKQLRETLASNNYLLVLDDVWTENRIQWKNLVEFLLGGRKGSWIVVTTRSHETAKIVGGDWRHELQGLSKEDSRLLFEMTAFGMEQSDHPNDLVKIGREIVEKCSGVPLAIKVAGSLLYGQNKTKWLSFQKIGLSNLRESQKNIMPILKLSYDQLESPLKTCFTYCALFPKDAVIKKELLISLWMAQGFIIPLDEGQTVDDAAEEYFSILLRRCFFQDVDHDEYGVIYSCKMHDLMHDVAQQIAGKEIRIINSINGNMDEQVRHLTVMRGESTQHTFTTTHIRSYISFGERSYMQQQFVKALVEQWVCLRALDLRSLGLESLPNSIGKLLHLRFLDLTGNRDLKVLPKSTTKLYNIETLNLRACSSLKELPEELSKLIKLRILDLEGCDNLTYMPRGMNKLRRLHTLNRFVVNPSSWNQLFDVLEELKDLESLRGKLHITIESPPSDPKAKQGYKREGGYLRNLEHLSDVIIKFKGTVKKWGDEALALVKELHPHSNVKKFLMSGYDWGQESCGKGSNLTLPPHSNLIELELSCVSFEHLTCLGNLPYLKTLKLSDLSELKYIIDDSATSTTICEPLVSTPSNAEGLSLFPSLELLDLWDLRKMEGCRRTRKGVGDNHQLLTDTTTSMKPLLFPQLKKLKIVGCPNLEQNLHCRVLEELNLYQFNKRLQIITTLSKKLGDDEEEATSFSSFDIPTLKKITIGDMKWLNLMPEKAFHCLSSLRIFGNREVECFGEVGKDVFMSMTSLQDLTIDFCSNLRSVSGGLEHLTSLERLEITNCRKLRLSEEDGEDGIDTAMPWASLYHSLRCLTLSYLPQLVELPSWIQFLTNLQTLEIKCCERLESLPNWMPKLTSLQNLKMNHCTSRLKERCQDSTGEDWPLIKHIPSITKDVPSLKFFGELKL